VRCPATADPDLTVDLTVAALAAFRVCGMRDYGRVDLRVDERGRVFILEVNANPDLAPGAGFARALAASGRSYDGFACALVEAAFLRGADMRPQAIGGAAQHLTEGRRLVPQAAEPSLEGTIALGNLDPADVGDLVEVLVACGNFRPDEVAVGREVLEEAARQAPDGHYQVVVARSGGKAVGWAAYGLVPLTDATYDLYWIAVHPRVQDRGAGRVLLEEVERRVRAAGGRWLLAETSGSAGYAKTHGFYLRRGYAEVAVIPDFYRLGDARSTFGRRLD
jgi:ribosomal protein S18 acetylase RimI-like enzyme